MNKPVKRVAHNRNDLTGQHFGRLIVLSYAETRGKRAYWLCGCSCGQEKVIYGGSLRQGTVKSCSCIKREQTVQMNFRHGLRRDKYYNVWLSIKNRCYNSQSSDYANYGGCGVIVCDEWKDDPVAFITWCKEQPKPKGNCSIDRYPDLNGPYSPSNCRFATPYQQTRNKRSNIWIEYKGEKLILADMIKKYGAVDYHVAKHRLYMGWNPVDAIIKPAWSSRKELSKTCRKGHVFTQKNTYLWNGQRHCKKCRAIAAIKRRRAKVENGTCSDRQ